jgi:hypothetical protein
MSFYTLHLSQNIITLTSFSLRQCGSPNYVSPEVSTVVDMMGKCLIYGVSE